MKSRILKRIFLLACFGLALSLASCVTVDVEREQVAPDNEACFGS